MDVFVVIVQFQPQANKWTFLEIRIETYPGQYYDEETGFHYNYHRYYDPRSGRYLRPDPIGLGGGVNLFGYALNNPINEIDALGLLTWKEFKDIIWSNLKATPGRMCEKVVDVFWWPSEHPKETIVFLLGGELFFVAPGTSITDPSRLLEVPNPAIRAGNISHVPDIGPFYVMPNATVIPTHPLPTGTVPLNQIPIGANYFPVTRAGVTVGGKVLPGKGISAIGDQLTLHLK